MLNSTSTQENDKDPKATYRESGPKGAGMSDPGRGGKGQSGETDSQNKTPEHHLWNSQRKHDASPGPKLSQSGEAAGQGHRAQRPSPRHRTDRHGNEYNVLNTANFSEISALRVTGHLWIQSLWYPRYKDEFITGCQDAQSILPLHEVSHAEIYVLLSLFWGEVRRFLRVSNNRNPKSFRGDWKTSRKRW